MALTKLDKNLLGFSDDTDFVKLPSGTTGQRPGSPAAGQFRFNTTINDAEVYDGTAWQRMGIAPPTFSSVDYPGNDTALDPAGDQSLIINGGTFNTGVTVTIGGTTPSSITRNSATQLTVTTPAKSAGTYAIVITNSDGGTSTAANAVSYNGIPAFSNAAGSLGSVEEGTTVSLSAAATEPDGGAIGYTITSGSLPSGLSINASTGAITGTAPSVSADTTSNFTVTATDNENQSTARAYSITVTNMAPSQHFSVKTYTGNGGTQAITGIGFKPDLVWVKKRSGADDQAWFDSSRGVQKELLSNSTAAEATKSAAVSSFDSDGFTTGANGALNASGATYVAWCFKANEGTTSSNSDGSITTAVQANTNLGFSIVTYTGTGGVDTVGHGLGTQPELIILKNRSRAQEWAVYDTASNKTGYLNHSDSFISARNDWMNNNTAPTTSVFTVRSYDGSGNTTQNYIGNYTGDNYVAYCFDSIAGFSKVGSYTGNGSSNIIETGFEPAFVIIKRTSGSGDWRLYDNKRGSSSARYPLYANLNNVEGGGLNEITFLSNGFILGSATNVNDNGETYIYIAFAADPDTTSPTLANSFDALTYTGSNSAVTVNNGFKTGLLWSKARNVGHHWGSADIVRGIGATLFVNEPNAQPAGDHGISVFGDTSTTLYGASSQHNTASSNYIGYFWKADDNEHTINTDGSINSIVSANPNAGFSVVRYDGTQAAGATVGHGLSSAPELIMVKRIDYQEDWVVYHHSLGNNKTVHLNNTDGSATDAAFNNTTPTSSVFTLSNCSSGNCINSNSGSYIAYCWHSVTGYSKIGTYTGTNPAVSTNNSITTGFQPDFLLVKLDDNGNSWNIYDSARSAKGLYPNTSGTEINAGHMQFDSNGFTMLTDNHNYYPTGGTARTMIYMAIKIN